jgi:hypothetical protein
LQDLTEIHKHSETASFPLPRSCDPLLDDVAAEVCVDQPAYRVIDSGHKAGVANAVLPGDLREFPCFEDTHQPSL